MSVHNTKLPFNDYDTLCILKKAPKVNPNVIFADLRIYRTVNGLLFFKNPDNTHDACCTLLAADQWKREGKKPSDFFNLLPSRIPVENKLTDKGVEEEQVYQSLALLGGVEKGQLPETGPLTALARTIKHHGSLILPIEQNRQRHWIVVDNVVQISARTTPTNPFPQLGVAARVPIDGTHRIYNGEEFWKNLRKGQYFFYQPHGQRTPLTPTSLKFFWEKPTPSLYNHGLSPLKMHRYTNLLLNSPVERPGSLIETPEPLKRQSLEEPESPGHSAFHYYSGNLVLGAPPERDSDNVGVDLLDLDPDGQDIS